MRTAERPAAGESIVRQFRLVTLLGLVTAGNAWFAVTAALGVQVLLIPLCAAFGALLPLKKLGHSPAVIAAFGSLGGLLGTGLLPDASFQELAHAPRWLGGALAGAFVGFAVQQANAAVLTAPSKPATDRSAK